MGWDAEVRAARLKAMACGADILAVRESLNSWRGDRGVTNEMNRAIIIAVTKLEEAEMWLDRCLTKRDALAPAKDPDT